MSGPPPMPLNLKLLRGNPGKQKLRPEPQPTIEKTVPAPPAYLDNYAQEEWLAYAPALHAMGMLTVLDVAAFAAFCSSVAHWRQASEALAKMASHDPVMHGQLVRTQTGDAAQNPLVSIVRKYASDVMRLSGEFGLTPAARSRIGAGYEPPQRPSKFDGLLGGGRVVPMKREK